MKEKHLKDIKKKWVKNITASNKYSSDVELPAKYHISPKTYLNFLSSKIRKFFLIQYVLIVLITLVFYNYNKSALIIEFVRFLDYYALGYYLPNNSSSFVAFKIAWYFSVFLFILNIFFIRFFLKALPSEFYEIYQRQIFKELNPSKYKILCYTFFILAILFAFYFTLAMIYYFPSTSSIRIYNFISSIFFHNFFISMGVLLYMKNTTDYMIFIVIIGFKSLYRNRIQQ